MGRVATRPAAHIHALSLYLVWYNFCRIHKTLRVTPAMAADLSHTAHDVIGLIGARDGGPKNRPCKKREIVAWHLGPLIEFADSGGLF